MRIILAGLLLLVALATGGFWLLGGHEPRTTLAARPETIALTAGPDGGGRLAAPQLAHDPVVGVASLPPPAPQPADRAASANPLLQALSSRPITYNRPPATLILGRPIEISLVINATGEEGLGAASLQGFPGEIVERAVELSSTVSAQLTGVGFDISSPSIARQKLSARTLNRWQWRVTPTEPGTRTLILEIYGHAPGSADAEPLGAYRDDIVVEVRQFDQLLGFARRYQPVFAIMAGIAAALSALVAILRFGAERKARRQA